MAGSNLRLLKPLTRGIMSANLVVTYDPAHAGKAKEEVKALLEGAGEKPEFLESGIEGLFLLKTKKNPRQITKQLMNEDPASFAYTFHWVPIDKWVPSDMESMLEAMAEIDGKMDPGESWKMDLSKRRYEGRTTELVMKLTESISKPKVDLKNPEKIVKVEIVGDKAGVALLNKDELLDVPKLKREAGE